MSQAHHDFQRLHSRWPLWAQYAVALGLMAAALGVRWLLNPVLGEGAVPFLTVYGPLLILVLLVRPGPFLAAAVVGGAGALLLFTQPRFSLYPADIQDLIQLLLFAVATGAAAVAARLSRRFQERGAEADRELARRTEELRLVTDAMPALISYLDADQRYRFVNARYVEWFEQPAHAIVGRRLRDVLGDVAYDIARPHVEAVLSGRRVRYELPLPYRYGGTRHVVAEYVPQVREDGSVAGFFALVSDVTEQKRAEEAQARLAAIVEASGDAIMSISLDGTFLSWNAGAQRLFGYEPEEVIGRPLRLILPPQGDDDERLLLERVRAGEVAGPYDTVRRTKDGRDIDVSVTVSPIRDARGRVTGASKIDRDVSARRAAERALLESERMLSTLVSNLPGAVFRFQNAPDWPVEFVSEGVADLLGYGADEFLSGRRSAADLVHAEDRLMVWESVQEAIRQRRSYQIEYRVTHQSGDVRWVWERGTPVFGTGGELLRLEAFVTDVSERKQAEEELHAVRARERSYLDHLPVGVFFTDERGEIVYANEAASRIWGGVRMVGPDGYQEYEAYWPGTDRRLGRDDWTLVRACRSGEAIFDEVVEIVGFDGVRRVVLNSAVPVKDERDHIVGGVVMNVDITEIKRAEAALLEGDRRKDEFLATLAHELRNPLAAVDTATELLARPSKLSTEQLDHAGATIRRQLTTMSRLVDDLLDVSRITRGTLELRRQRVELARVVDEAITAVSPQIERSSQTLEITLPRERVVVQGDCVRLVQVLVNVLGNASTYSEAGTKIEIGVRRDGADVVVEVRDEGIGIRREELERVFEMFTRLGSARDGPPGLGIGLTLCRQIVEMHGGRMHVHSEGLGRGSTFSIRLPAAAIRAPSVVSAPVPAPTEPEAAAPRRVLVVDDNVDAADMLAILLEGRGHEVRTAYDGGSAIRAHAAFRPDVVLLDLGLPDMDGVDVCREIRGSTEGGAPLVVAVSGWGMEEDKRRTAEAGFDAHLTKPARIEQVTSLVEGAGAAPAR